MSSQLEVVWRLRELMAARGLFMTSEMLPLLKARGIELSREQVYRIVTSTPQRLSLDLLGALCSILDCTPNDLIQYRSISKKRKAVGERAQTNSSIGEIKLIETKIARPKYKDDE